MISIIIPTREEERAITETITQFAELTIPHEVIVADCMSADKTRQHAERAGGRVYTLEDSLPTAGKARNLGALHATGAYLIFIDAGVHIPQPAAFIAHALALFAADPTLLGITGPQYAHPSIATWADRISFYIFNTGVRIKTNVLHIGEASGKFMMVRRDAFEQIHGFREDIHTREDGDFFNRLGKAGRVYFDPTLAIYHDARRAHRIGWARLWWIWIANTIIFSLTGKDAVEDWKPVR